MADEYHLTVFEPGQRAEFEAAFAADGRPVDPQVQARRIWWTLDNPAGGAFCIIRHGATIAATSYLGGKRLHLANQRISGFEIGETATDPAHQRRGLFSKLVKASCTYAETCDRLNIYGTPNSQSTPGYAKLGFHIVEDDLSWLFVLPNIRYFVPIPWFARQSREIGSNEYIAATQSFARLNFSNEEYLNWRLVDAPMSYRFFEHEEQGSRSYLTFRFGQLGRFKSLICSEYFIDGAKPSIDCAARIARSVARAHFSPRAYALIQIHGARPAGSTENTFRRKGIFPHRALPICTTTSEPTAANWFERFQLSDCDIG